MFEAITEATRKADQTIYEKINAIILTEGEWRGEGKTPQDITRRYMETFAQKAQEFGDHWTPEELAEVASSMFKVEYNEALAIAQEVAKQTPPSALKTEETPEEEEEDIEISMEHEAQKIFASLVGDSATEKRLNEANTFSNSIPQKSIWAEFAQAFDVGMVDLDSFAQYMGYRNFRDLNSSRSPRSLYHKNPPKFIEAIKQSSLKAQDMSDEEIANITLKSRYTESKLNEKEIEEIDKAKDAVDAIATIVDMFWSGGEGAGFWGEKKKEIAQTTIKYAVKKFGAEAIQQEFLSLVKEGEGWEVDDIKLVSKALGIKASLFLDESKLNEGVEIGDEVQVKDKEGNIIVVPKAIVADKDEMLGDDGEMHTAIMIGDLANEDEQQWYREDEYQIIPLNRKEWESINETVIESYKCKTCDRIFSVGRGEEADVQAISWNGCCPDCDSSNLESVGRADESTDSPAKKTEIDQPALDNKDYDPAEDIAAIAVGLAPVDFKAKPNDKEPSTMIPVQDEEIKDTFESIFERVNGIVEGGLSSIDKRSALLEEELEEIPVSRDIYGKDIKKNDRVIFDEGRGVITAIWNDGTVDIEYAAGPGGPLVDTFDIKGHEVQKDEDLEEMCGKKHSKKKKKTNEGEVTLQDLEKQKAELKQDLKAAKRMCQRIAASGSGGWDQAKDEEGDIVDQLAEVEKKIVLMKKKNESKSALYICNACAKTFESTIAACIHCKSTDVNSIREEADLSKLESSFEQQLAMGVEVEKEHTDDPEIAKKIAMDHLAEDPQYYTKLKKMEAGACDEQKLEESDESNVAYIKKIGGEWKCKWPDSNEYTDLTGWFGGGKSIEEVIAKLASLPANNDIIFKPANKSKSSVGDSKESVSVVAKESKLKESEDPREKLASELQRIGIDSHKATIIALDAGMNVVDKKYLQELEFSKDQISQALKLIGKFHTYDTSEQIVKEQEEKDQFRTIAQGIEDKADADELARKKQGQVVKDSTDEKKFAVIVKANKNG